MRKVVIGVLITIVLVGTILVVDHSRRQGSHPLGSAPESAKNLPIDLRFARFDSKETVSFKDFAGKVVLVNFWASWCEACMAEMPSIQKLYDQLKGEGFQVIAINVDDKPEKVVPQIVKGLHLTFPIYTEGDGELSKAFDVVAIPFSVVADRQQKIIMQEAGERDWSSEATVAEIRKLLKPI